MKLLWRRTIILIALSLPVLTGCVSTSFFPSTAEPQTQAGILAWVEEVCLGTEYQSSENVVSKWTRWSVTISAHSENQEEQAMVARVTKKLNAILKDAGFSLKLKKPNHKDPDIKVIFAPKRSFADIAQNHGFKYVRGNIGFFRFWSNGHHEIFKAVIMIDHAASIKMKNHLTHEEIAQALGLANDSPASSSSVFFERVGDGGKVQDFSALDRTLIRFLYKHVRAGADRNELRKAFHKHWGK